MAVKKAAPAKAAPAKAAPAKAAPAKETAIVPWKDRFEKYATQQKEQVSSIGAGGVGVKFGRNAITVGGTSVPGGKLECVIIGSCALNAWYEQAYDPDSPTPPDCYAFAVKNDDPEMAPKDDVASKQADKCGECPHNEWGSAAQGRGKACGNKIRLGLITAKDAEDGPSTSTAELATATVSPTNLKAYAGYVKALEEDHGRPVWAVVTEISSHDDPKTQIRLEFKMVDVIDDDDILSALEKRYLKIQDVLQVPFSAAIERPEKKAPARGNQRFAAKKAPARR